MRARVKVLTTWFGELPIWYPSFLERADAVKGFVEVKVLYDPDISWINNKATKVSGVSVAKRSMWHNPKFKEPRRPLCDLRPLYGEVFKDEFRGHEWWGWTDLDVVYGNFSKLWEPLMDSCDAISSNLHRMDGALSILRNNELCLEAWRGIPEVGQMLLDQNWRSIEEGFLGKAIERVGGKVMYCDKQSEDTLRSEEVDGRTRFFQKSCRMEGDDLIEVEGGRELSSFHFRATKTWPTGTEIEKLD